MGCSQESGGLTPHHRGSQAEFIYLLFYINDNEVADAWCPYNNNNNNILTHAVLKWGQFDPSWTLCSFWGFKKGMLKLFSRNFPIKVSLIILSTCSYSLNCLFIYRYCEWELIDPILGNRGINKNFESFIMFRKEERKFLAVCQMCSLDGAEGTGFPCKRVYALPSFR